MAYIGKQPIVGNFVKLDAITTSATATYNLLNGGIAYFPQTANNCIVSLNGVIQSPTSAYTISGSTIVFSDALTSSDTIDFILVLGDVLAIGTPSDGTVTNAKIAASTIDLTTKVTGTLPVANGGTGLAAIGTSLQVLRTNTGATALEFATVSSDYVLLASTDASSSSSVSFDGYFSSTYKVYQLIISDLLPVSSSSLKCRFRRSNADVTASNYTKAGYQSWVHSGTNAISNNTFYNYDKIDLTQNSIRVASSAQGYFGFITIFNPLNTSSYKRILCSQSYSSDDAGGTGGTGFFNEGISATLQDSTSALSGISFFMGTGNISSGNFKLYGIK